MPAQPTDLTSLPADLAAAHAMILAERKARIEAERTASFAQSEALSLKASASSTEALIAHLKLQIEKLRRDLYGPRAERTARVIDQMELQLEELEANAAEDAIALETIAPSAEGPARSSRRHPVRKPFPADLPRERVIIPAPSSCPCCGSMKLAKLGEDITETLEVIPRSWKVIQTVREKVSCRSCEAISQPPAPFHVTPRGFIGANLLAMILFDKFGQHLPLNRQSERYAREGIDLSVSTLADQVGAATSALAPLHDLVEAHVLAAQRLHADDTTVPILARGKTDTGRIWAYIRDDRPFAGLDPPAALFFASRDRRQDHPDRHLARFSGILQADAYAGYNSLYDPARKPGPVTSALCWAHARRGFFELADIASSARRGPNAAPISPIAFEATKRIDAIFAIEREINGKSADERKAIRQNQSKPLVDELHTWLIEQRAKLSRSSAVAKPVDYMLKRWQGFTAFLDDGRICISNNAAERALRGFALGRKAWLFAGSDRGAARAAAMATLIQTAKLNDIDPQAWLADCLARIASMTKSTLPELLPWNWEVQRASSKAEEITAA
jgi:transposase